jgi:DNA-binding NtrC family response regulator
MADETKRRPVVLLLDDELQLTAMFAQALEGEFEIETASNVEEARLLLGARRFDAMICDHMMPGDKQGLEFLIEAMTVQPEARRILMTGYMNPELLTRGVALARLSAVLLKPATLQQVRKALHDALGLSV